MAKNTGKVREFCQSGKVGTLCWDMTADRNQSDYFDLLFFIVRSQTTDAPKKLEVFVDGKSVKVAPGSTVLQVSNVW